jgi:hypothetical protein
MNLPDYSPPRTLRFIMREFRNAMVVSPDTLGQMESRLTGNGKAAAAIIQL